MRRTLLAVTALLAAPGLARAQDPEEARSDARASEQEVREIVRGYYVKSNIGSTLFLVGYGGGLLSGVMTVNLTVGSDFVDNERNSLAWEVTFGQMLQNGVSWEEQPAVLPPNLYIQGDLHVFSGAAQVEASFYPTRRLGLGLRAGGGVAIAPLLIEEAEYQEKVVGEAWKGAVSSVNGSPLPMVIGAPTVEYYTKLSHFSIGFDVEAMFLIGPNALGLTPSGYMKYTF
jgi:hypothetical protein